MDSTVTPSPPTATSAAASTAPAAPTVRPRRIIRRKKPSSSTTAAGGVSSSSTGGAGSHVGGVIDPNELPPHIANNTQLHHVISTTLPKDYEFEIPKTIHRIEKSNATNVALQLPEGLLMYASAIGDILRRFAFRFRPAPPTITAPPTPSKQLNSDGKSPTSSTAPTAPTSPKAPTPISPTSSTTPACIASISILGDVTYGACCIDDLSARSLGCDLLVHYGHSCLVPLTCTAIPCLYVFVEIRVDVKHLVGCVERTFVEELKEVLKEETRKRRKGCARWKEMAGEEEGHLEEGNECKEREGGDNKDSEDEVETVRVVEALVMGTVQFRSAVVEACTMLNRLDCNSDHSQHPNKESTEGNQQKPMEHPQNQLHPSHRLQFRAIVPQAKPLSPGEVLGCTAPSGLATMDFEGAWEATVRRMQRTQRISQTQRTPHTSLTSRTPGTAVGSRTANSATTQMTAMSATTKTDPTVTQQPNLIQQPKVTKPPKLIKQRLMIFLADGRFHLEAAMIANPSLRALRYDPYSKTLTEEKYEMDKMKKWRREAVGRVRSLLGITNNSSASNASYASSIAGANNAAGTGEDIAKSVLQPTSSHQIQSVQPIQPMQQIQQTQHQTQQQAQHHTQHHTPKVIGIILGTLGRQGNPAILCKIRSLLQKRGIRSIVVLLSEIFPKKLELFSQQSGHDRQHDDHGVGGVGVVGGVSGVGAVGVCAWVQIACPRLSIDWGHYFSVPVLSSFELFVALGEVADGSLWRAEEAEEIKELEEMEGESKTLDAGSDTEYPMDFYSKSGGPWANYYEENKGRNVRAYGA